MKILGVFFGVVDIQRDNWEPKLSKLDRILSMWKFRSLSMIGKSLVINVLGVSKLLHLARVLVTPRLVFERYNTLIWKFLRGSKIEPVARKTLHCPIVKGGLGIVDFEVQGRALRLASMLSVVADSRPNCFYLSIFEAAGLPVLVRVGLIFQIILLRVRVYFPRFILTVLEP